MRTPRRPWPAWAHRCRVGPATSHTWPNPATSSARPSCAKRPRWCAGRLRRSQRTGCSPRSVRHLQRTCRRSRTSPRCSSSRVGSPRRWPWPTRACSSARARPSTASGWSCPPRRWNGCSAGTRPPVAGWSGPSTSRRSQGSWPPRSRLPWRVSAYERGEYDEVGSWAGAARGGDGLVGAAARSMLALGHRFGGRLDEAESESAAAVATVRDATDDELAAHAELLIATAWSLVAVERLDDALLVSRRASGAALRAGNGAGAVPLLLAEVLSLGLLGRTEEAAEVSDRAEVEARLTRNDQSVQWALWMRAWVLLEHGDLDAALRGAEESVALARRLDESALVTIANAVLGSVLLADGRPSWRNHSSRRTTSSRAGSAGGPPSWSRPGSPSVTSLVRRRRRTGQPPLPTAPGSPERSQRQSEPARWSSPPVARPPSPPRWPVPQWRGPCRSVRSSTRRWPICWPAGHSPSSTRRQRSRT